jgi:glutamate formiminotransferase/formiminotetrahydrofolate cyclodeaminase
MLPLGPMREIVECVPNFSAGRDASVVDQIVRRIDGTKGVCVLHVDIGVSANRTVVTLAGEPDAVVDAAFAGISAAREVIDLRSHSGVHWRQGATDVCPLVPLSGVTMEQCVSLARCLAQRVGETLDLPVYLYAEAASSVERRDLARVRRGGYEGLEQRFREGRLEPDFGPAAFDPRSGATAIGARPLMIAYNVNLACQDVAVARAIARSIRERGTVQRDGQGRRLRDPAGRLLRHKGLAGCRANGWLIEEYQCAQVTCNLIDFRRSGLHAVYQRVDALAREAGVRVCGSEIIGLVPETALLEAGRSLARQADRSDEQMCRAELLDLAVSALGLARVRPFSLEVQLLERRLEAAGLIPET